MFFNKLKLLFLVISSLSFIFLIYNWYDIYSFKNNPLSDEIKEKIYIKQKKLEKLALKKFNITRKIPVIVSNKMPSRLFGAATATKDGTIIIYLNKKRFQESTSYMIEDVLPHEYAHALMFVLGDFSKENGGHTLKWQKICLALEGKKCDRFVNHNDIILNKTNIF